MLLENTYHQMMVRGEETIKPNNMLHSKYWEGYYEMKDISLIIAVIYHEDLLTGSVFQNFEEAYELAKEFQKKYPHDFNWEAQDDDFDEAIIKFVNLNQQ